METRGTAEQIAALYGALAQAKGEYRPIRKTAKVKFFSKKLNAMIEFDYAPYDEIVAAITPANSKYGIDIRQPFETVMVGEERMGKITTVISHKDGACEISDVIFTPSDEIKELGGQTTYVRRYAINCHMGLSGSEDSEDNESLGVYQKAPSIGKGKPTSKPQIPPKPEPKPEAKPAPKPEAKPEPEPEEPRTEVVDEETGEVTGEIVSDEPYTEAQKAAMGALTIKLAKKMGWRRGDIAERMRAKVRELCGCETDQMTVHHAALFIDVIQQEIDNGK